jgi:selenocysteine lyase/cysteine desulfurase
VRKYDQFSHSAGDYKLDYREGALRFECGSLNTVGVYGLRAALDLFLEVGPERIEDYILSLSDYLGERLRDKNYEVISPRRTGEKSAIVCCKHRRLSAGELYGALRSRDIITAPRMTRLRISPHFYNTREEVDTLVNTLPE